MAGKRAGARRGAPPPKRFRPAVLGYAVAITLAVVAWGFLVYSAIDFGVSARSGEPRAWWFLALASVGAMACLFLALMLVARIIRGLGATRRAAPDLDAASTAERPAVRGGGHRAKR